MTLDQREFDFLLIQKNYRYLPNFIVVEPEAQKIVRYGNPGLESNRIERRRTTSSRSLLLLVVYRVSLSSLSLLGIGTKLCMFYVLYRIWIRYVRKAQNRCVAFCIVAQHTRTPLILSKNHKCQHKGQTQHTPTRLIKHESMNVFTILQCSQFNKYEAYFHSSKKKNSKPITLKTT